MTQPRPSHLEVSLLNTIKLYQKFQINSHLLTLSKEKPIETITAKHKKLPELLSIVLIISRKILWPNRNLKNSMSSSIFNYTNNKH